MAQFLLEFLKNITNDGKLLTLLISIFPLVELKGAIPIGLGLGENLITSALLAYVGSTLICIPIYFLLIPIFNLLKKIKFIKKLIEKIELVFKNKALKVAKGTENAEDKKNKILALALFIFVAVPFPVTGVWTGTAIAVFLQMKFSKCFLPLVLGNLVAGILITLLTFLFSGYVNVIIDVLFVIALTMLIVFIVKVIKSKPDTQKPLNENQ